MPHIEVDRRELEELIGEEITDDKLNEEASFLGAHWNHVEGPKWDVEVYPDRPDLLSVEGLARAYRGFFDVETGFDEYEVKEGGVDLKVEDSVESVRPYIGGAVIRNLELSEKIVNGWIQFQEKLHESVGRKRKKIAIGLHDMEDIEPPFTYRGADPDSVSFNPLEHPGELNLGEILDRHDKGQEYRWILEDSEKYPVILDSNDEVLSFPPIINNQLTEVDENTTDIFIDVTGTHKETVEKVISILSTAMAERGGDIEGVTVEGLERTKTMPDLEPESRELGIDYFKKISGVDMDGEEIARGLEKMKFRARAREDVVEVGVPTYRTDVMHQYDLIEDVVIAHGYNNIEPQLPEVDQISDEKLVEDYTRILRDVLQGAGGLETHTYILSNKEKLFGKMGMEPKEIAVMSNALTEDHSAVRNWLLPSLMDVLRRNRHRAYPQRFYEIADVSVLDDSEVGASNVRKGAYVACDEGVDYTDAKQVLQTVERELGLKFEVDKEEFGCFEEGRSASLHIEGEEVGLVGEFSEDVCENWGLERKVAGFEVNVDKIMEIIERD